MKPIVIKVSAKELQDISTYYNTYKTTKEIPYALFFAKKDGTAITAYTSGKVMFQGPTAQTEAARWQDLSVETTPKKTTAALSLPSGFAAKSIIGSDEVGNGSYFGPLVVCAVYAESDRLPLLKELGVKDSKMLSDIQIKKLAPQIKACVPFQLLIVSPKKYNQIQPQYNTIRMKVALHNQAIALLLDKIAPKKPEAILIDQFTPEKNYRSYLRSEKNAVTESLYFATKGEQYHLAVAAASILCRAVFLEELEKSSQVLGLTIPSGAGKKSDQVAATLLKRGGLPLLENYAKLHFANTQKAQKLAQQ